MAKKESAASKNQNQKNPIVEVRDITPEQAQELLSRNTANFRKLSEARTRALADVMRRGLFKFNGVSLISMREDGTLRDGQTRLAAVVSSGVPIRTLYYEGPVDDETSIDTGSKRTAGQTLAAHSVPNANSTAAAIKAYIALFQERTISHLNYAAPITSGQVLEFYQKNQQVLESVRKAAEVPIGLYQALVAAVHFAGMSLNPEHTEWWINALTTGENLNADDPVLRLRAKFTAQQKHVTMSRIEQAALLIKSWNLIAAGKPVKALAWRGAGPNPEDFPVLGEGLNGDQEKTAMDLLGATDVAAKLAGKGDTAVLAGGKVATEQLTDK